MPPHPAFPLTIFYDGACVVCAVEMERYRRKDREGRLRFVDISAPEFDPGRYGRSREQFMEQMHAIDARGRLFLGVDAFPAIWEAFPDRLSRLLGALLRLPGLQLLARGGYRLFARYRRFLPRRRCEDGTCHLGHPR